MSWRANAALAVARTLANRLGFDLVHRDFYSPVPDVAQLPDDYWIERSGLAGVTWTDSEQVHYFRNLLAGYLAEFDSEAARKVRSGQYRSDNGSFGRLDAAVLFAFVRLVRPRRVVEVGAGFSTLVTASAVALNARDGDDCEFVAIDPYPRDFLHGPIDGLNRLERRRAEDIAAGEITTLERNDILFIDSTHVAKVGSDVVHLALELLPRLAPGVLVHIHDIYLPWSYPRGFVEERGYYWNEQYVVQALLSGSRDFEIMLSTHWLGREHGTLVRELLPDAVPEEGGSLWLRRSAS